MTDGVRCCGLRPRGRASTTLRHAAPWPSLLFTCPCCDFRTGSYLSTKTAPTPVATVATYLIDVLVTCLAAARSLPGLLAVVILLTTHLPAGPRGDRPVVLAGMLGESIIWTLPLFVLDRVLVVHTALRSVTDPTRSAWVNEVVRSFGAGIYEELVFRLMCITGLSILLVNVCKLPRAACGGFIVLLSAGLFAAQHHPPLGVEAFDMTARPPHRGGTVPGRPVPVSRVWDRLRLPRPVQGSWCPSRRSERRLNPPVSQQIRHGPLQHRVDLVGGDLGQRLEHETPLVHRGCGRAGRTCG